jgi:multiple antibiotic resistance protein
MLQAIATILQIFTLINPLASFPVLMQAQQKKLNVRMIALKATVTAFIIAVVIALIGPFLMDMFGITINSLRVAGGIVLLILGIQMVLPKDELHHKLVGGISGTITLIATPLITGPGTISYITVKTVEIGVSKILLSICVAFVLVGAVFVVFAFFVDRINDKIVDILSRVMGLFLCGVAIQMITVGLEATIKTAITGSP